MPDGLDLAEQQLRDLADLSQGAIEILKVADARGLRTMTISMDTQRITTREGGIRVRDRERFDITVRHSYPFRHPSVSTPHRRWARTNHVQWGRQLCLYAAPAIEWVPSDGMDGLIERLSAWLVRAAEGQLDPEGQPLHPPVAYAQSFVGRLVIHPDVGDLAPWGKPGWDPREQATAELVAWCAIDGDRIDVLEWLDWSTAHERASADKAQLFRKKHPYVAVPVLLISDELGFEYPDRAWDLVDALSQAGHDLDAIMVQLAHATTVNRTLRRRQTEARPDQTFTPVGIDSYSDEMDIPLLTAVLVGTPARRVETGRLTHFAGWALGGVGRVLAGAYTDVRREPDNAELMDRVADHLTGWLRDPQTETDWMRVLENRPEVTRPRDTGMSTTWLRQKRILILGCGALGGPIAEYCVRAGAAKLTVMDNGVVTPGILVRQPYEDADVGHPKSQRLASRLNRIQPRSTYVESLKGDVVSAASAPGTDWSRYDLIIDATANASVRSAIERRRLIDDRLWPPVVTTLIGHDASRGIMTLATTEATAAGAGTLRTLALHALTHPRDWSDVTADFFPAEQRREMFFPEPGCSEPTFTGGSPQTTALAGLLLAEATRALVEHRTASELESDGDAAYAAAVRIGDAAMQRGTSRNSWTREQRVMDDREGYEVRLSPAATTEMRGEVRRAARTCGPRYETGGMLLGSVDDATRVIHVDRVTGPPPDSYLLTTYFWHGTEGTQQLVEQTIDQTNGLTGFVGYWHSHPNGPARPSPTDVEAMASLVTPDGGRRRTLMVILGGPNGVWTDWVTGRRRHPDTFARLVPRPTNPAGTTTSSTKPPTTFSTQVRPAGEHCRGGYGLSPKTVEKPASLWPRLPWNKNR